MRILVVTNLYPPRYLGGYELLCDQACRELRRRGHHVTVLTSDHPAAPGQEAGPEEGVHRVLRLTSPFDRPLVHDRRVRREVGRHNEAIARAMMDALRPDLVFVWSQLRLTLGAARAACRARVPTAFTMNDDHALIFVPATPALRPRRLAGWLADATAFRELYLEHLDLSHVTCISLRLKERLVAGGLPVPHARVIYQSIPVDRFPPREQPGHLHRPPRLLFVGQLHAWKGVHVLLQAMARLAGEGRDLALTVAGAGDEAYTARLREMAAPLGDRVRFPGRVAHAELPALYRSHDTFVFPSTSVEGFGLTYLEAMASGLPVVATDGGGHGEVLHDGRNALIFPEGDDGALAACLARVLDDEALRRRLAQEGCREVRARFSFQRYADEIEEFLEDAARFGPGRRC